MTFPRFSLQKHVDYEQTDTFTTQPSGLISSQQAETFTTWSDTQPGRAVGRATVLGQHIEQKTTQKLSTTEQVGDAKADVITTQSHLQFHQTHGHLGGVGINDDQHPYLEVF